MLIEIIMFRGDRLLSENISNTKAFC